MLKDRPTKGCSLPFATYSSNTSLLSRQCCLLQVLITESMQLHILIHIFLHHTHKIHTYVHTYIDFRNNMLLYQSFIHSFIHVFALHIIRTSRIFESAFKPIRARQNSRRQRGSGLYFAQDPRGVAAVVSRESEVSLP